MTLIEIIVVLSIFMIVSTMVMFNYGKFESSISLQNLADDIALTVREAQSYAIGARGLGGSNSFFGGYGIHFAIADPSISSIRASRKSFVFFADVDDEKKYNFDSNDTTCGSPDKDNECYKVINISSADYIKSISVDGEPENRVDIFFKRPYPEPSFCVGDDIDDCTKDSPASSVSILIENLRSGKTKAITITNTGQISVK